MRAMTERRRALIAAASKKPNLFVASDTFAAPSNTAFSNATKRTWVSGTYARGLTSNNYYGGELAYYEVISSDSFIVECSNDGYGIAFPIGMQAGRTYKIDARYASSYFYLNFVYYSEDGSYLGCNSIYERPATVTVPDNARYAVLQTGFNNNVRGQVLELSVTEA